MAPDTSVPSEPMTSAARYPFGTTRCAGRSATSNCKRRVQWVTSQDGENPMACCGVHLSWLIRLRTAPGASIKVERVPDGN